MADFGFRWTLIGLAALNAVICIFLEDVVMEKGVQNLWKKYGPTAKTKYNEVENWMTNHPEWPSLSSPQVNMIRNSLELNQINRYNLDLVMTLTPGILIGRLL